MKAVLIGPKPDFSETEAEFVAKLGHAGEAAVRAEVENDSAYRRLDKLKWLNAKELARQVAAIEAGKVAAEAAQKSARWAIWSAIIAMIALVVAVIK